MRRTFCSALTLLPIGNLRQAVPEGLVKIAQRFNAGIVGERHRVPKGRLINGPRLLQFNRPFGTYALGTTFPALKRRAIVGSPSGTTLQFTCL
jgi:hypothetical protein